MLVVREVIMKIRLLIALVAFWTVNANAKYLGNLSANPFNSDSTANAANRFNPDSVTNPYGQYGNAYSNTSANNPYVTNAPKLYDSNGNYRGRLSNNKMDPDSVSNPYGRYGNPYSPDSINNPYGAGNKFNSGSPNNPYGQGWRIESGD